MDLKDTINVPDLDTFVELLVAWHSVKVKTLEHMLTVPENTEVTFDSNVPKVIAGDYREGFIAGISLSLMELGALPFAVKEEPLEPQP